MKATVILAVLVLASLVQAQQKIVQEDPAHSHCEMMKRGEKGMGFSQQTTTHHFRLLADGGAIEIGANDPKDTSTRDQIRQHLSHVAKMFSDGNFEIPMFIHDKTPPGVPTMTELRDQIHYDFEPMDSEAGFEFTQVMRGPWRLCTNSCNFRLPSTRRVIL